MRLLWWAAVLVLVTAASQPAEAFKYDFLHGVASGDPLSDSIVLWTRITHRFEPETTQVRWVVLDAEARREVASSTALATASSDFTIKVIVDDLLPATEYTYFFEAVDGDGGSRSPTGNFRTLPDPSSHVDRARFAVFSCSNWGWGYWNAYDAALSYRIDFWIHLGGEPAPPILPLLAVLTALSASPRLLLRVWPRHVSIKGPGGSTEGLGARSRGGELGGLSIETRDVSFGSGFAEAQRLCCSGGHLGRP